MTNDKRFRLYYYDGNLKTYIKTITVGHTPTLSFIVNFTTEEREAKEFTLNEKGEWNFLKVFHVVEIQPELVYVIRFDYQHERGSLIRYDLHKNPGSGGTSGRPWRAEFETHSGAAKNLHRVYEGRSSDDCMRVSNISIDKEVI